MAAKKKAKKKAAPKRGRRSNQDDHIRFLLEDLGIAGADGAGRVEARHLAEDGDDAR